MSDEEQKTYSVLVYCANCHHAGQVRIPRGQTIDMKACPVCGCNTLRVQTKVTL